MTDKNEIKRRYKLRPADMGIYQIQNRVGGRVYIGRAMDLNGKLNSERFQLKNGLHMNRELQADFSRLGEPAFSFSVLDRLDAKDGTGHDPALELKELEQMWLERLQPYDGKGYHKRKA